MSWDAVYEADHYLVKWGTSPEDYVYYDSTTYTEVIIPNLRNGTIYYIAISAVHASDVESENSAQVIGRPWYEYFNPPQTDILFNLYRDVSDIMSDAILCMNSASEYMFNSTYEIVLHGGIETVNDLLYTFNNAYLISYESNYKNILGSVKRLNNFLLRKTFYNDLNEFLEDQDMTVKPSWADICRIAGYDIDNDNIS